MTDVRGFLIATGQAEAEHRVKGSRFISVVRPISTLADAVEARDVERRRFHDATHHVFAARQAGGECRFDDNGEPTGTGGRPVLAAIERAALADVVVVVTRYYGGTKLGTGGLSRAYSGGVKLAMEGLPTEERVDRVVLEVVVGYEAVDGLQRLLTEVEAVVDAKDYGEKVSYRVAVPEEHVDTLTKALAGLTKGRGSVRSMEDSE